MLLIKDRCGRICFILLVIALDMLAGSGLLFFPVDNDIQKSNLQHILFLQGPQ